MFGVTCEPSRLVRRVGDDVRARMGAEAGPLSEPQTARAVLPADAEAARLYAEGRDRCAGATCARAGCSKKWSPGNRSTLAGISPFIVPALLPMMPNAREEGWEGGDGASETTLARSSDSTWRPEWVHP